MRISYNINTCDVKFPVEAGTSTKGEEEEDGYGQTIVIRQPDDGSLVEITEQYDLVPTLSPDTEELINDFLVRLLFFVLPILLVNTVSKPLRRRQRCS